MTTRRATSPVGGRLGPVGTCLAGPAPPRHRLRRPATMTLAPLALPAARRPRRLPGEGMIPMANALPPGPSAPRLMQGLRFAVRPVELFEDCARRYGEAFTLP